VTLFFAFAIQCTGRRVARHYVLPSGGHGRRGRGVRERGTAGRGDGAEAEGAAETEANKKGNVVDGGSCRALTPPIVLVPCMGSSLSPRPRVACERATWPIRPAAADARAARYDRPPRSRPLMTCGSKRVSLA
jgi:hypothetical protein